MIQLLGSTLWGRMASAEEFTCPVCNEAFENEEELEEHGKEAHQDHDPEESDDHA